MAYTIKNFKSKKEFKNNLSAGEKIKCYQHGIGPDLSNFTGWVNIEGPHYPKSHTWYAEAYLENGIVQKVK